MNGALTTERLTLPQWTPGDAELLTRLSADPEVMRYIADGSVWPAQQAAERAQKVLEHWTVYGFGWRPIVVRGSERGCGLAGLNYLGEGTIGLDPLEFEVGWWLAVDSRGRGYATEAAQAVADEAFGRLEASSVIARIAPANRASIAVAQRLGMVHDCDTRTQAGVPVVVYRLPVPR